MSGYLQRLLAESSLPSPSTPSGDGLATPPPFLTKSAVFEADRRLGVFPDLPGTTPLPSAGEQTRVAASVDVHSPEGSEPTTGKATSKKPNPERKDPSDSNLGSSAEPNQDTPSSRPRRHPLQSLIESAPLPEDFGVLSGSERESTTQTPTSSTSSSPDSAAHFSTPPADSAGVQRPSGLGDLSDLGTTSAFDAASKKPAPAEETTSPLEALTDGRPRPGERFPDQSTTIPNPAWPLSPEDFVPERSPGFSESQPEDPDDVSSHRAPRAELDPLFDGATAPTPWAQPDLQVRTSLGSELLSSSSEEEPGSSEALSPHPKSAPARTEPSSTDPPPRRAPSSAAELSVIGPLRIGRITPQQFRFGRY